MSYFPEISLAFFVRNNFLFPKKILSSEVPKFWKLRIFWPRSCLARGVRTPRVSPRKIFGRPFSTLNPKVTFKNASVEFKPPQAEFFCLVGICSGKNSFRKNLKFQNLFWNLRIFWPFYFSEQFLISSNFLKFQNFSFFFENFLLPPNSLKFQILELKKVLAYFFSEQFLLS